MEKLIKLKSREENNILKRLSSIAIFKDMAYLLVTSFVPVKVETLADGRKLLKPRGSAAIVEGEMLEEAGAIVKEVIFTPHGWVVIFNSTQEEQDK